jgi:predicted Zn-dependent peptidase
VVRGATPVASGEHAWAAASLGLRLRARLVGSLLVEVGAEGLAPLLRHRFFDGSTQQTAFQQSPVTFVGFVGAGLQFR